MTKKERLKRAKAILNEARANDVINPERELPQDEDKLIKLADQLVSIAREAYNKGERGSHVESILFTADIDWSEEKDANDTTSDPDEKLYKEALSEAIENLPIPPKLDDLDIPEFPPELASISDAKLFEIHGVYSACSARMNWLHALQEAGVAACKIIADKYEDSYIINVADRKDIGGKAKSQALLKAEARENDANVKKWREREENHKLKERKYYKLAEIYDDYVDRCSRQYTFRSSDR